MVGRLFSLASRREMLAHRSQTLLSLLGVALGVAVMVGVDLANESARRAFALSMDAVSGQASHRIEAVEGALDEGVYTSLRVQHRLRDSTPVMDGLVRIQSKTFRLLGVDPLANDEFGNAGSDLSEGLLRRLLTEPGTLLMSNPDQQRLGITAGDTLAIQVAGGTRAARVIGELRGDNSAALEGLLVADIATAQELLDRTGRLDRIDLQLTEPEADQLRERLPADLMLKAVDNQYRVQEQMTRAFHINLSAMGLLALLVGLLIVYNTMTFSVLRRQPLLGMLRVLGCTRQDLFLLILRESLVIGALGSLLGLLLGVLIGHGLISMVTRTINDLYFVLTVSSLLVTPAVLVKGLAAGLAATLAAALAPALEAAGAAPQAATRRSEVESRTRGLLPLLVIAGGCLMVAGWVLLAWVDRGLIAAFIALFLLIIGYAMLIPLLLLALVRGAAPAVSWLFGRTGRMAARGISAGLSRSGIAVAALSVAVSATVGVGIMVESFRDTVAVWLQQTLSSDIYVTLPGSEQDRARSSLPPGLLESLAALPGVASVSTGRMREVSSPLGPLPLIALGEAAQVPQGFRFKQRIPGDLWARFRGGEAVFVSEALAYHHHLQPGDTIRLETSQGTRDFLIGATYIDYSTDLGIIAMDRASYARYWHDPGITTAGLRLAAGTRLEELLEQVHRQVAEHDQAILVRANQAIREQSMGVFDRTFAITGVLRLLAVGVAFIGVLSALLALQMERAREHATLRALGLTPGQLAGLVFLECALMGLMAGVLALPLGWGMSELLIEEINQRAFGWSMQTLLPAEIFGEALMLALAAALLAGIYPALRLAQRLPAVALREE